MVHKNYKWNLSEEEGRTMVFSIVEKILKERKNNSIEINELIFLINLRSKNIEIRNNNKKKNLSNFIKVVLGGMIQFIDDYDKFLIYKKDKETFIRMNNFEINEWIFVENSE